MRESATPPVADTRSDGASPRRAPHVAAPVETSGVGHGTGHKVCDSCDATIWPDEARQEVKLERGRTLRFHSRARVSGKC